MTKEDLLIDVLETAIDKNVSSYYVVNGTQAAAEACVENLGAIWFDFHFWIVDNDWYTSEDGRWTSPRNTDERLKDAEILRRYYDEEAPQDSAPVYPE